MQHNTQQLQQQQQHTNRLQQPQQNGRRDRFRLKTFECDDVTNNLPFEELNSFSTYPLSPGSALNPSPVYRDLESRQKARYIDKLSRKLFPLAFLSFNLIYWLSYILS